MFTVSISYAGASRSMRALNREVPGIAARVLTEFARVTTAAEQREMPRAFDRPTPFTVNRMIWQAATRAGLQSAVGIPDSQEAGGKPTSEYMRPGALGSAKRNQKKTEFLLSKRGFLPPGWLLIPGSHLKTKLDGYGNVPGSYYKQVIRSLQIRDASDRYFKPVSKASQARAARMGVASEFFVASPGNRLAKGGGSLPAGVYRRAGRDRLQMYFRFTRKSSYEKRLDMPKVAQREIAVMAPKIWPSVLRDVATRAMEKAAMRGGAA